MNLKEVIFDLVKSTFSKLSFVHDFYFHKKELGASIGFRIKNLVSAILSIKIKNDISVITFNLNNKKYRLYLACNKIITAIKSALVFIRAIITKDKSTIKELGAISISKKEYKKMKENAKNIKKKLENEVRHTGPLVIKLGNVNDKEYFNPAFHY